MESRNPTAALMQTICSKFVFYGTEGCHLCDEARDLLDLVLASMEFPIDYSYIDIVDNDQLMAQYGTLIPVIKAVDSPQQLSWPFDDVALTRFLLKLMPHSR